MSNFGSNVGEVSAIKIISSEAFDALVDRFMTIPWPVAPSDVDRLLAEWGWAVVERVGESGIVADPGFGFDVLDPCWIHLHDEGGAVRDIVVAISDEGDDDATALRDAFAGQVASIGARLGAPNERESGKDPVAVWHLPSESRLVLYGSGSGELLKVTSPEWGRQVQDTE